MLDSFISDYEAFLAKKINDIEFFMILPVLPNILRYYRALINPEITKETETTRYMVIMEHGD